MSDSRTVMKSVDPCSYGFGFGKRKKIHARSVETVSIILALADHAVERYRMIINQMNRDEQLSPFVAHSAGAEAEVGAAQFSGAACPDGPRSSPCVDLGDVKLGAESKDALSLGRAHRSAGSADGLRVRSAFARDGTRALTEHFVGWSDSSHGAYSKPRLDRCRSV